MIFTASDQLMVDAVLAWIRAVTGYPDDLVLISSQRGFVRPQRPFFTLKGKGTTGVGAFDEPIQDGENITMRGGRIATLELQAYGAAVALLDSIRASRSRPTIVELNFEAGIAVQDIGEVQYIPAVAQGVFEDRAMVSIVVAYQREETEADTVILADEYEYSLTLSGEPGDLNLIVGDDI